LLKKKFFQFFLAIECCIQQQYVPQDGRVTFINYASFTAKFSVTYDYGTKVVVQSEPMWFNKFQTIAIPGRAGNVHVAAQRLVFVGVWESLYSADISGTDDFCIVLRGTLYQPDIQNC
jgi:hypothetical protein